MLESKIPLLREILVDAEAHPEVIDLNNWARVIKSQFGACRTTVCIAGSAVLKTGYSIDWDTQTVDGCCNYTTDGQLIDLVAEKELGLSGRESDRLFYCDSLDEAWRVAERISGGQITREARCATACA